MATQEKKILKSAFLIFSMILLVFLVSCSFLNYLGMDNLNALFKKISNTLTMNLEDLPDEYKQLLEMKLPICVSLNNGYELARAIKIIDGDSIIVEINGQKDEVRYIGINTPEFDDKNYFEAQQAANYNRELVQGKNILMIRDVSDQDRYGRLLRYVFTVENFVNLELLQSKSASIKAYPPDISCHMYFLNNLD